MKRLISILVGMFILSAPVLATSGAGACSTHGGVNCSFGMDMDGSVVCNDGWRDSSVQYSDALECNSNDNPYTTMSKLCSYSNTDWLPIFQSKYQDTMGKMMDAYDNANIKPLGQAPSLYTYNNQQLANCLAQKPSYNEFKVTLSDCGDEQNEKYQQSLASYNAYYDLLTYRQKNEDQYRQHIAYGQATIDAFAAVSDICTAKLKTPVTPIATVKPVKKKICYKGYALSKDNKCLKIKK